MDWDNALSRLEAELGRFAGRRGRDVLDRWGRACPLLASAGLRSPRELPAWVWSLGRDSDGVPCADAVLRALVEQAQAGDTAAAVGVLACLRPGICALARRTGLSVDEAVSEVACVLGRFPVARRANVAAQLLLDARNSVTRQHQREKLRDVLSGDTRVALEEVEAPGAMGLELSPAEQWAALVINALRAGEVCDDDARLIVETRVAGDRVAVAAARRGINRTAAYQRRQRAEAKVLAGLQ